MMQVTISKKLNETAISLGLDNSINDPVEACNNPLEIKIADNTERILGLIAEKSEIFNEGVVKMLWFKFANGEIMLKKEMSSLIEFISSVNNEILGNKILSKINISGNFSQFEFLKDFLSVENGEVNLSKAKAHFLKELNEYPFVIEGEELEPIGEGLYVLMQTGERLTLMIYDKKVGKLNKMPMPGYTDLSFLGKEEDGFLIKGKSKEGSSDLMMFTNIKNPTINFAKKGNIQNIKKAGQIKNNNLFIFTDNKGDNFFLSYNSKTKLYEEKIILKEVLSSEDLENIYFDSNGFARINGNYPYRKDNYFGVIKLCDNLEVKIISKNTGSFYESQLNDYVGDRNSVIFSCYSPHFEERTLEEQKQIKVISVDKNTGEIISNEQIPGGYFERIKMYPEGNLMLGYTKIKIEKPDYTAGSYVIENYYLFFLSKNGKITFIRKPYEWQKIDKKIKNGHKIITFYNNLFDRYIGRQFKTIDIDKLDINAILKEVDEQEKLEVNNLILDTIAVNSFLDDYRKEKPLKK